MNAIPLILQAGLILTATAPAPIDPSPFGINGISAFHYAQSADWRETASLRADAIDRIGARWDRLDFWWHVTEPARGRYDWSFPDALLEFYAERNIHPLPILCYSSAWSGGVAPRTPDEKERFAAWVFQVVNRYKDRVKVWQIWNEPNIPTFWKPRPSPEDYADLLLLASREARRADPECTLVLGPTSVVDIPYLEQVVARAGGDCFDVVSFHPYSLAGGPDDQNLDILIERMADFIDRHCPGKPLWFTEIGQRTEGLSQETQSDRLLKTFAMALGHGVEKVFWYCLTDWSEKWGIVLDDERTPKEAAESYRRLTNLWTNYRPAGTLDFGEDIYAYLWAPARGRGPVAVILWSREREHEIELLQPQDSIRVTVTHKPAIHMGLSAKYADEALPPGRFPFRSPNRLSNPAMRRDLSGSVLNWHAGTYEGRHRDGQWSWRPPSTDRPAALLVYEARDLVWESATFPAWPGRVYRAEVLLVRAPGDGRVTVSLDWYGGTMWGHRGTVSQDAADGAKQVIVGGTPPPEAVFGRLTIRCRGTKQDVEIRSAEVREEP